MLNSGQERSHADDFLGEDDEMNEHEAMTRLLTAGTLEVQFHRVCNVRTYNPEGDSWQPKLPEHGAVPEKIVKGSSLSHVTRYAYRGSLFLAVYAYKRVG